MSNKMAKCFLSIFILFFAPVLSNHNASCLNEGKDGICMRILDCPVLDPLVKEIREAGRPTPIGLMSKLTELGRGCGHLGNEPLVCCVPTDTEATTVSSIQKSAFKTSSTVLPEPSAVLPNTPMRSSGGVDLSNITEVVDIQKHHNFYLLPNNCGLAANTRIYNGEEADLFEMPWMVLLIYQTARGIKPSCSGTLINERYVLTAAHCVTNLNKGTSLIRAVIGEYNYDTNPDCITSKDGSSICALPAVNMTIQSTTPHPEYDKASHKNDIAVVRLSAPVDFDTVNAAPICLPYTPELQSESLEGKVSTLAGWGATEHALSSNILLRVNVPIIPNSDCGIWSRYNLVTDKQICASGAYRDSCSGDSGGPLMLKGRVGRRGQRQVLRGIVSYGSRECGRDSEPSVNTRVASYLSWILDNMTE